MTPEEIRDALTRTCPRCGAGPGRKCHYGNGHSNAKVPHKARLTAEETADA